MTDLSTTTTAPIFVGVPVLDAEEARQIVKNITGRIDQCRRDLLELKDREGWRALGYASWRACVEAEFGSSTATLYRQLAAAEIARGLDDGGDSHFENLPTSHLQAVKDLPPAQARQALASASAATGGKPTVKAVQAAVQAVSAPVADPAIEAEIRRLCAITGSKYLGTPTLPYPTATRYRVALMINGGGGGDYLPDEAIERLQRLADDQATAAQPTPAEAPDLPLEFAVAQRRFSALGHVLSAAWDGQAQRFVVRKDGGTGVVLTWPDVVGKLARLEGEAERDLVPAPASETAHSYAAKEARDTGRLERARNLVEAGELDAARTVLAGIEVATWKRDELLRAITTTTAQRFLAEQRERLTRMSPAAMISQTTFKEALAHLAALLENTP